MPQIGWFEILIVVGIAIVVIGPKDFPIMLKKIGSWIGTAKRYVNQIQEEVSIIGENENENEIKNNEKKKISKGEDDKN
jgi:sec-independent protein translocase protein TatB